MIQTVTLYTCLILASLEDLRRREVPFLLSHATIILGLAFAAQQATTNPLVLLHSTVGGVTAYILGYLLYTTGQWGGGDVKLLTGIATFIGFNVSQPSRFIAYLLLVFLAGGLYGIAWASTLFIKEYNAVSEKLPSKHPVTVGITLSTIGLGVTTLSLFYQPYATPLAGSITLLVVTTTVIYVFRHAGHIIEEKTKKVDTLVPGDWLTQEVSTDEKTIDNEGTGLTPEQIQDLRSSSVSTVTVQRGIPFVPSFLLGYVLLQTTSTAQFIAVLV